MKAFMSLLIAMIICIVPATSSAKSYHSSHSHHSSYSHHKSGGSLSHKMAYSSHTYRTKSYRYSTYTSTPRPTYKLGTTKYYTGRYYKTTGYPMVDRSSSAKERFLKSKGYTHVPPGYEVDHIIPLSRGGTDDPSNMELITKSAHHAKTAQERKRH